MLRKSKNSKEKRKELELEQGIYDTVRWFDLFDRPVTHLELTERLVGTDKVSSLVAVRAALKNSGWLRGRVEQQQGLVFLRGREGLVQERLMREARAQRKWKLVQRVGPWLACVPFVKGLAGSGSLAIFNTKAESDLDIFVITSARRIWLARLGLLLVGELSGRRRHHWHRQAPDRLCLNHYVSEDQLMVDSDIQNIYTAMLYTGLVPLYGEEVVREFQQANRQWVSDHMAWRERPPGLHTYTQKLGWWQRALKSLMEVILAEPVWDVLEEAARAMQLYFIRRHQGGRAGRVVTTNHELAFHPDTKVPSLLARYEGSLY